MRLLFTAFLSELISRNLRPAFIGQLSNSVRNCFGFSKFVSKLKTYFMISLLSNFNSFIVRVSSINPLGLGTGSVWAGLGMPAGCNSYLHTYIHKSFIKTMTERIDFTVKTKSKCALHVRCTTVAR